MASKASTSWEHICYMELDRVVGLLHTDDQGGRVITCRYTRKQGYYTQFNKETGLVNLDWSRFYNGAIFML